MRAMRLHHAGELLQLEEVPRPEPGPGQVLVAVDYCGVCRTDLHIVDGDLIPPSWPVTPGHEVVGRVAALPQGDSSGLRRGQSVGVPWLGHVCGHCHWCESGRENLCPDARFTGYSLPGGYADYLCVDANFCFALPDGFSGASAAPLLCAGLIGYRSLRLAGDQLRRVGIYGFGAAAHLVAQIALARHIEVYAYTRPGDLCTQQFARELGCQWAGSTDQKPPQRLDAALIFAPAGELVPVALTHLERGGRVVCGGIHMSPIPSFDYADLWLERSIVSVANLTRRDGEELLEVAARLSLQPTVTVYPFSAANQALDDLRHGRFDGAAVLDLHA